MLVTKSYQLGLVKGWLDRCTRDIAYDIETTGLNAFTDQIIGIGLSDSVSSYYLVLLAWNKTDQCLETVLSLDEVMPILELLKTKKLVTWNGAFDLSRTLRFLGLDLIDALHIDGMLLKHTVNEESRSFALKETAIELFGAGAASEQTALFESIRANGGAEKEFYKADVDVLGKYCLQDCKLTLQIKARYLPMLKAEGTHDFFFNEVMELYKTVTIPMEMHGVTLDMPLLQQSATEIAQDIVTLEAEVQTAIAPSLQKFKTWFLNKDYPASRTGAFAQTYADMWNLELPKTATGSTSLAAAALKKLPDSHAKDVLLKKDYYTDAEIRAVQEKMYESEAEQFMFNPSSKHHLKKLFFDCLGETAVSFTDLGNPQVDDDFLDLMAQKYDWVKSLQAYNRLTKIRGTYVERFLERQVNGRYYPSFLQHRTVSGRYGSDLQQLPRKVKDGHPLVVKHNNRIRDFLVSSPRCSLVGADYNSLEPRVFAHCSGDTALHKIFQDNLDFYSEIAIRTEGLVNVSSLKTAPDYLGLVNPEARQAAKPYALGIPYGMSAFKLAFELGLINEADFSAYKDVKKALEQQNNPTPEQQAILEKVYSALSEAQDRIDAYLYAFQDLAAWMDASQEQAQKFGFVRVESGRVRHLVKAKEIYDQYGKNILDTRWIKKESNDSEAVFESLMKARSQFRNERNNAINIQVQGLAASIVNRACIAIMKQFKAEGLPACIIMQIHDEVLVECDNNCTDRVREIIQTHMESAYTLKVPLIAVPVINTCYGALK